MLLTLVGAMRNFRAQCPGGCGNTLLPLVGAMRNRTACAGRTPSSSGCCPS